MIKKSKTLCIGQGVLRATIVTLICFLVYTVIISLFLGTMDNLKLNSALIMIFTCLSIFYGAAYAAKKSEEKGWFVGLMVAVIYSIIIYIISIIAGRDAALGSRDIVRMLIALVVGTLSGMLGINL